MQLARPNFLWALRHSCPDLYRARCDYRADGDIAEYVRRLLRCRCLSDGLHRGRALAYKIRRRAAAAGSYEAATDARNDENPLSSQGVIYSMARACLVQTYKRDVEWPAR